MDNSNSENFNEFLLAEYEHIADAHFETGKQVSTFFNYYLLILAAPVIIVTLTQNKNLQNIVSPGAADDYLIVHWIAFAVLLVIALFGMCLSWIVIELQHDAILYARSVNGIRNYFYKSVNLTPQQEKDMRVLPTDVTKPGFFSYRHLGIIVFAFAFVNASFLCAALIVYFRGKINCTIVIAFISFFILHFIIHAVLSSKKKSRYG